MTEQRLQTHVTRANAAAVLNAVSLVLRTALAVFSVPLALQHLGPQLYGEAATLVAATTWLCWFRQIGTSPES